MQQFKVLLFDLDVRSGAAQDIVEVLQSSADPLFELHHATPGVENTPEIFREFARNLKAFEPDVTFLLLDGPSELVQPLFEMFHASKLPGSAVAVACGFALFWFVSRFD